MLGRQRQHEGLRLLLLELLQGSTAAHQTAKGQVGKELLHWGWTDARVGVGKSCYSANQMHCCC